ncbi:hypothetical protein HMI54_002237 [Coelomomyces lativittatus]|nr:hypothetical protein HMI54_002237 [Coelomomyces lativittatus]
MVSTTAPNEKLPLPSIKYNNDGTITHIYHKYDDNGQRCKIKRTIDLHRNPEKCKSAIEQRQKVNSLLFLSSQSFSLFEPTTQCGGSWVLCLCLSLFFFFFFFLNVYRRKKKRN